MDYKLLDKIDNAKDLAEISIEELFASYEQGTRGPRSVGDLKRIKKSTDSMLKLIDIKPKKTPVKKDK